MVKGKIKINNYMLYWHMFVKSNQMDIHVAAVLFGI